MEQELSPIEACINRLTDDLKAIAGYIISPDHTRDDLFQIMVKVLIERAQREPDFINQKDAYILKYASWNVRNAANSARTYLRIILPETIIKDDEGDEVSNFDFLKAPCEDPESQIIRDEAIDSLIADLNKLKGRDHAIVCLMYCGYSRTEIAKELGITKSAITQRARKIAEALKNKGQNPGIL